MSHPENLDLESLDSSIDDERYSTLEENMEYIPQDVWEQVGKNYSIRYQHHEHDIGEDW